MKKLFKIISWVWICFLCAVFVDLYPKTLGDIIPTFLVFCISNFIPVCFLLFNHIKEKREKYISQENEYKINLSKESHDKNSPINLIFGKKTGFILKRGIIFIIAVACINSLGHASEKDKIENEKTEKIKSERVQKEENEYKKQQGLYNSFEVFNNKMSKVEDKYEFINSIKKGYDYNNIKKKISINGKKYISKNYEPEIKYYLEGSIKNISKSDVRDIEIVIGLYDSDGNQTGTVSDTMKIFEKDSIWKFKINLGDLECKYFKILEVNGFK